MLSLSISLLFCVDVFADELIPREVMPKHPIQIPSMTEAPLFDYRLTVKFRDDWQVRIQESGELRSITGKDLTETTLWPHCMT